MMSLEGILMRNLTELMNLDANKEMKRIYCYKKVKWHTLDDYLHRSNSITFHFGCSDKLVNYFSRNTLF